MPSGLTRGQPSRETVLDPTARIRKLSDYGSSVEIDRAIPIQRYFRSGSEMERQARVYYSEGQLDRAFILYNKFATLFVEKLPKHPEYSKAIPTDKARIKKLLKQVFPRAMELKDKLKIQFEKEKEALDKVIEEEERAQSEKEELKRRAEELERQAREIEEQIKTDELVAFLAAEATTTNTVTTEDNMSQSQTEPTDVASFSTPVTPGEYISPSDIPTNSYLTKPSDEKTFYEEACVASFGDEVQQVVPPQSLHLTATDPNLAQVLPLTAEMEGLAVSNTEQVAVDSVAPSAPPAYDQVFPGSPSSAATTVSQSVAFNPVIVQQSHDLMFQAPYQNPISPQQQAPPTGQHYSHFQGPAAYPYGYQVPVPGSFASSPVPYVQHVSSPTPQFSPSTSYGVYSSGQSSEGQAQVPSVDRSTKPASLNALSTSSNWEDSDGYRTVVMPADIASQFEQVASPNTRKNIETCGILAGKLAQNSFRMTHIIVPKQIGKADSCETVNEEELFDVQDKYDLITLGWIHTHPSQTAFMSSVDLHCHCSYQIMLDEAIAIVCAPKYSQVGKYMLTDPHGLNYITHCEQEGFHVHPKHPPLYEDCKHIQEDRNSFIQIVDLR